MTNRGALRGATVAFATAAQVFTLSSCLDQHHLVGEGPPIDAGITSGAGTGGAGGQPAGMMGAPGGSAPGGVTDGGAAGAPVTSLGDETSQGWALTITPEEVARRLSQFIFQQPPSDALTAAVVAAAPKTNQDVGQLTDGLLLNADSAAGRRAFYLWWLNLDRFTNFVPDPTQYPLLTVDAVQSLLDQTLAFIEDVTWRPNGDLATLLTEPSAYVTAETAPWYPGVTAPASGAPAVWVALDGARYAGIVTAPLAMVSTSFNGVAAPTPRGRDVRTRYQCGVVPPPPANLIPPLVIPPGQTIRQAVEAAVASGGDNGVCQACHALTDDQAFAFGHFDPSGIPIDTEGGAPIDTAGAVAVGPTDSTDVVLGNPVPSGPTQTFTGPADLAQLLAQLSEVRLCFAAKWLAFVTGSYADQSDVVELGSSDALATDAAYVVARATIQGQLSLRGTIRAVTEAHTFLDP